MSGDNRNRYASAGVSIERGNRWVDAIRPLAAKTDRNGVVAGIGGFGGVFRPEWEKYRDPVLVSGTDGVGTKLKVAQWAGIYEGLGIDLVAMCANDIAVMGAEPLFFLDYYASGRLDPEVGKRIFSGIAEGCRQAGAALLGGETAEMPGVYQDADFDLAGFVVGIADREKIVDGRKIGLGHRLYGLPSTGIHSNGFSLVRKVLIEERGISPGDRPEWSPGEDWSHILTRPTRIYVPLILEMIARVEVSAMVHVTGGGLTENVPRVLPEGFSARINPRAWEKPPVFQEIQKAGKVTTREMFQVFNMGIGLVVVVPSEAGKALEGFLSEKGETFYFLGEVIPGGREVVYDRSF
ncbi:MAG: Phosphoribosylformylglycinamidine cyclo-ligase [Leptospirillum sp. Group II 'C75']|jgi:phosphoribosylformylglycinamidine cyclo-ligase|uniref:Phosphoribosylformylglycinamidine cyclo-ligase n=2 Tax=Leptospirillum ferriphilum TaxID=178606 RepID=A0A059Y0J7_9BACT|nr:MULTISPECIES: phosphoribosylformylglycinamidine cyclo-ligase [Leptospirillum]EAY56572.1 MAG: phosphoribosylformylglycinamidine cyclo-ligase [Leptospirillum rubarum]EIJ77251.1 MAG: Phosphoribosylformylglycinamidine cyclo-ligase [Leptospirillum sp. Group II 'C75']AFS54319.1 phosphoribosylformylglycinamidine cyclo-ligase [Leptospirillum ferriphilum ML-04]AIA31061.1 phosphoribosylaminoimidazole synthetase [Leptospirillum ferriphilum YSK]AKS24230.1 phosphoribosylaminoimidazole synthetase [Leptos